MEYVLEDNFVFLMYENTEISKYPFNSNAINEWIKDNPKCPLTRRSILKKIDGPSEIRLRLLECFIEKYKEQLEKSEKSLNRLKDALSKNISEKNVAEIEDVIKKDSYQSFIVSEKIKIHAYTLHEAVLKGELSIVKLLLDRGANINDKNNYGNTALMWAAEYGSSVEVIELLREKSVQDNEGNRIVAEDNHRDNIGNETIFGQNQVDSINSDQQQISIKSNITPNNRIL